MSESIQFYRHQIRSEYHSDGRFLSRMFTLAGPADRLGTLFMCHDDDSVVDDPVDAGSLFYPTVQNELAKMLVEGATIELVQGFGIASVGAGFWHTSFGVYSDFARAVSESAQGVGRQAYAAATDGQPREYVEQLYRIYFDLMRLLRDNNV